jgi:hypothetical protein
MEDADWGRTPRKCKSYEWVPPPGNEESPALCSLQDASGKLDPDAALQFLLDSSCRGIDLGMSENDWKDLECDVRG